MRMFTAHLRPFDCLFCSLAWTLGLRNEMQWEEVTVSEVNYSNLHVRCGSSETTRTSFTHTTLFHHKSLHHKYSCYFTLELIIDEKSCALHLIPAATPGPTPFPNGCFDVSKISPHTTEFLVTCVCETLSQFVCDVCHVLQKIEEVGKFTVEFQNNLTHFEKRCTIFVDMCMFCELVTVMSLFGHEQSRSSKNVHEVDTRQSG